MKQRGFSRVTAVMAPAASLKQSRLVLCPYGIPTQHRAVCNAILMQCGGDVNRLIDAPAGAEPFLRHIKRLSGMLSAVKPPIVLLTEIVPLMQKVVELRRRYEAELPVLTRADWKLFLNDDAPTFVAEALQHGQIERESATATWHGPENMRFDVVSLTNERMSSDTRWTR
jgi:hypothetical protein